MKSITTLSEFDSHLTTIAEILIYSKKLASNSQAMRKPEEIHKIVKRNNFLKVVRDSLYELSVIELTKLYSKGKDDYCIRNLLSDLQNNLSKAVWANKISVDEIKALETGLREPAWFKRKIDDLIILRNNHLAHTAKERFKINKLFTYEDLFDLINAGEIITNELSCKILDKPIKFPKYNGEDASEFLSEYARRGL